MNLPTSLSCLKSLQTTARAIILKQVIELHAFTKDSPGSPRLSQRKSQRLSHGVRPCRVCFSPAYPPSYFAIVSPSFISLFICSAHQAHSSRKDFIFAVSTGGASLRHVLGFLPRCQVLTHMPSSPAVRGLPAPRNSCPPNNPRSPSLLYFSPEHLLLSCVLSLLLIYFFLSASAHKTRNSMGTSLLSPLKPCLTQNSVQ